MSTGSHISLGLVVIAMAGLAGLSVPRPKAVGPEVVGATYQKKSSGDGHGTARVPEIVIDQWLRTHRVFVRASAGKRHRVGTGGLFTPIDHDPECIVIVDHGNYITTRVHCELKK